MTGFLASASFTDRFNSTRKLFKKREILQEMRDILTASPSPSPERARLEAELTTLSVNYDKLAADVDFDGKQKGTAG